MISVVDNEHFVLHSVIHQFCLKSVRNAADLSYESGLLMENTYFKYLITGFQSIALRYSFFAERTARKVSNQGMCV